MIPVLPFFREVTLALGEWLVKGEEWRPAGSYCRNKSWKWGLLEVRGLQRCFCEGPSSQYFRLCRPGSLLLLLSSALPGWRADPAEAGPQHCADSGARCPRPAPVRKLLLEPLAPGGSEHFCLCGFCLSLFPVFELKRRKLRYLLFHFKVVTSLIHGNKTSSMKNNFLKQAKDLVRRQALIHTLWTLRRGRRTAAGSAVSRSRLAEVCGENLASRPGSAGRGRRSEQPFLGGRVPGSAAQPGGRRRPGFGGALGPPLS